MPLIVSLKSQNPRLNPKKVNLGDLFLGVDFGNLGDQTHLDNFDSIQRSIFGRHVWLGVPSAVTDQVENHVSNQRVN